jgi:hypothetical protein
MAKSRSRHAGLACPRCGVKKREAESLPPCAISGCPGEFVRQTLHAFDRIRNRVRRTASPAPVVVLVKPRRHEKEGQP